MYYALLLASVSLIVFFQTDAQETQRCKSCGPSNKPVCGQDGNTYTSFCIMKQTECMLKKEIRFACNGECPCDPEEIAKFDPPTFHKLQELRSQYQLVDHEKEEENNKDFLTFEILDGKDINDEEEMNRLEKKLLKEQYTLNSNKYYKRGSGECPTEEMSELPARLIDWFHVLKINEKEKKMKDQGIEQEPVLKEMKFLDSKLKSMYSSLACTAQDDEDIEKQVCLTPVKWMFQHLDTNQDKSLSATELYDIEEINKEHCIKPFLRDCDVDKDGKVVLKEFCKCLCIAPPCTQVIQDIPTMLIRGELRPMPSSFTPICDEDGFFLPRQCNKKTGECWCVDRNGAEFVGTRRQGDVTCGLNIRIDYQNMDLIPLDLKKENA